MEIDLWATLSRIGKLTEEAVVIQADLNEIASNIDTILSQDPS